ncbi:MAG: hypothetical protein SF123_12315 [Chloroflexota bacterium]|jgi:hypothetical protein|nr:hypothetical protein [Chloroflexota bacterium]
MIRLTVLYNLPPGTDEAEFLRWRLGEHQESNSAMPGVVTTDFGRIDQQWTPAGIQMGAPYRFMTVADFADRASFERAFLSQEAQDKLREDIKKIDNPLFLVSEILVSTQPEA